MKLKWKVKVTTTYHIDDNPSPEYAAETAEALLGSDAYEMLSGEDVYDSDIELAGVKVFDDAEKELTELFWFSSGWGATRRWHVRRYGTDGPQVDGEFRSVADAVYAVLEALSEWKPES